MNNYDFTPIGSSYDAPFTFKYDGQGYKIYNLKISLPDVNYVGLFGYVASYGERTQIANVHVASGSVTGYQHVGGIVGNIRIKGASKDKYSAILGCHNKASVSGDFYVGGIAGTNGSGAIITVCVNTGEITAKNGYAGGITGSNAASDSDIAVVEACYNTGNVTGVDAGGIAGYTGYGVTTELWQTGPGKLYHSSEISSCYNTGTISGRRLAGGLVGEHQGRIEDCYNTGKVSGPYAGMLVGRAYYNGRNDFECYMAGVWRCYWLQYDDSDVAGYQGDSYIYNDYHDYHDYPDIRQCYRDCYTFSASDWPSFELSQSGWKSMGHWVEGGTPNGINSEFPKLDFEE